MRAVAVGLVVGVVAVVGTLLVGMRLLDDPAAGPRAECRDAVTAQLKSPGTVEWGDSLENRVDQTWVIEGYVDSQNTFGAMVRTSYVCTWTASAPVDVQLTAQ